MAVTADVRLLLQRKHFAAFAALQFFGSYRTNNGHHRTLVRHGSVAIDPTAVIGGAILV
jgi:hypothetical protein